MTIKRKVPEVLSDMVCIRKPLDNPRIEEKRHNRIIKKRFIDAKKRNPDIKLRARNMVAEALRVGKLRQKTCEKCYKGCKTFPTEAHHLSYEIGQELNVIWLCKSCHTIETELEKKRIKRQQLDAIEKLTDKSFDQGKGKKIIYHICGLQCSGKSTLIKQCGIDKKFIWDVGDFYKKYQVIDDKGKKDHDTYDLIKDYIDNELESFLTTNYYQSNVFIIESSGINQQINNILDTLNNDYYHVIKIVLKNPTTKEIIRRSDKRGSNTLKVIEFNRKIRQKINKDDALYLNPKEALKLIKNR